MISYLLMLAGGGCILFCKPIAAALGYAVFWLGLLQGPKKIFLKAFIWGTLLQGVQLFWLAAPDYHGLFILVAYALICLMMGAMWGLFATLVVRGNWSYLALAALWTLVEWGRLYIFCGFAWNHAGLLLGSTLWGRQLASVAGVLGLTFAVMYTNFLFIKNKRWWLVTALLPYVFGYLHVRYHDQKIAQAPKGKAILVQTGLLPEQKAPLKGRQALFIDPFEQWKRALQSVDKADWIVFPEAAFPFGANTELFTHAQVEQLMGAVPVKKQRYSHLDIAKALAQKTGAEIVIGLDDYDKNHNYNSVFHIEPNGGVTRWDKQKLLPIAEALPFSWMRPLAQRYGISEFFTPGTATPLAGCKAKLSASVCYDECFSHIVRCPGAKMHVNVSNDGWYPRTRLNHVHFEHGRLRSIENGICLLRSCNTGITAAIDSIGRVIDHLETEDAGVLIVNIPLYSYRSFFARFGMFPLVCICFVFVALELFFANRRSYWLKDSELGQM